MEPSTIQITASARLAFYPQRVCYYGDDKWDIRLDDTTDIDWDKNCGYDW